ncbi:MAG: hypothetical protein L3J74_05920 [Bacteroidales bacterium]|nr:hypothetical protein [Bacteroidales bacterium]
MKERIYPIYHKGKTIYYTDWTNLLEEKEALDAIEHTTSFIENNNEYNLLEIVDITNSYASPTILNAIKNSAKRTKPFSFKKAIVGIKGSKKILLMAVNKFIDGNIKGFNTVNEAKEWLVADKL